MNLLYALLTFISASSAAVAAAPIQVRRATDNGDNGKEIAVAYAELEPVNKSLLTPKRNHVPARIRSKVERRIRGRTVARKKVPKHKKKKSKPKKVDPEESGNDDPDSGDIDESGQDDETDESGRDDIDDDTNSGDTNSGDTDDPDDETGTDRDDDRGRGKGQGKSGQKAKTNKHKKLRNKSATESLGNGQETGNPQRDRRRTEFHDPGNDGDVEDEGDD